LADRDNYQERVKIYMANY